MSTSDIFVLPLSAMTYQKHSFIIIFSRYCKEYMSYGSLCHADRIELIFQRVLRLFLNSIVFFVSLEFPYVLESNVCSLKIENKLISPIVLLFLVKSTTSKVFIAKKRNKNTFMYSELTDNFQFLSFRALHIHIWWIESERWWFIKGKRIKSR